MATEFTAVVEQIDDLADGVRGFVLRPAGPTPFPAWQPGAHVDLQLGNGLRRSYSLCGEPDDALYRIAVARDPCSRGGSAWLCEQLHLGDRLLLAPPRNHFPLVDDAPHSVFIAGGIGITPLLPMLRRLSRLGRPWQLHYAARTRASAAFVPALQALAAQTRDAALHTRFGDTPGRQRLDLQAIVASADPAAQLYCCGPAAMLAAFETATSAWPAVQVHVERFAGIPSEGAAAGFVVELARSGRCLAVPPGSSILAVLQQAGIDVAHACQEGVCGSCEVEVLAGTPDHRDLVLSAAEKAAGRSMMICCSGAKSPRLTLDL